MQAAFRFSEYKSPSYSQLEGKSSAGRRALARDKAKARQRTPAAHARDSKPIVTIAEADASETAN
jgi:hypothetical protein